MEDDDLEGKVAEESPAYAAYKALEHWQPLTTIVPPEQFLDPSDQAYSLFAFLYHKTRALYEQVPSRHNGDDAFLHPLNVAWSLKRAGVQDSLAYCVALLHDVVEETVDIHQREKNIPDDAAGIGVLDKYEETVFGDLERDLREYCQQNDLPQSSQETIVGTVRLLTRHKRHFYYQSISEIFDCPDEELREKAIPVKLADCSHNVLSIEKFDEGERLYQCFKNLFILNNVKEYLLAKNWSHQSRSPPMEVLFRKCAEATYDALLETGHLSRNKIITNVTVKPIKLTSMIQLALKQYKEEELGFTSVTEMEEDETSPICLFQGIIRKYDARLHHEWDNVQKRTEKERKFCQGFFRDFHFTPEQLQAVIDYKDAYALKEVVACLLYQPRYVLQRFLCSALTTGGRIEPKLGHL